MRYFIEDNWKTIAAIMALIVYGAIVFGYGVLGGQVVFYAFVFGYVIIHTVIYLKDRFFED